MHNSKNKKTLQIVLIVLIAVLTLGIGYATISNINLIINGDATANPNDNNFKVKFLNEEGVTPKIISRYGGTGDISITSDTTATFNIIGLDEVGDSATAKFKVKNVSNGIGAGISLSITNSNSEYFKVSQYIQREKLQAGDESTVSLEVEIIKTPVESAATTSITATLTATPIDNADANIVAQKEGDEEEEIYTYSLTDNYIDSEITDPTYPNFSTATGEFGNRQGAIAHILNRTIIKESYLVLERNGQTYYLRGGAGDESEQANMPIYDANVAKIKKAFGSAWTEYCAENEVDDYRYFECIDDDFNTYVDTKGYVNESGSDWGCNIDEEGKSTCER